MGRTLQWSAADGAARQGLLEHARSDAPRPAALIAFDEGAQAFADTLAATLHAAGWSTLRLSGSALADTHGDRARAAELERALAALAGVEGIDARRLALVGVGMLGTQAFLCACASRRVAALVDVCGPLQHESLDAQRPVQPLDMLLNLGAPCLIVHARDDARFGVAQATAAAARMERAARSVELVTMPCRARDFLAAGSDGYHVARAASAVSDFLAALRED
jgi:dienelactone hydrolase